MSLKNTFWKIFSNPPGANELTLLLNNTTLTHLTLVPHICVSELVRIVSDNGLSPIQCEAIIWTNAGLLSIAPKGKNISEISIKIQNFSFTKMHVKISSVKSRPFSPGLNVLTRTTRMPAFWGYPLPPLDYPYHWVILDPKSKEDKVKVTNLKNSPKFQVFETGITRDTASEVAW